MTPATIPTPPKHPQHVQVRITEREYHLRRMVRMQELGEWARAANYHEEFIAPLNDWLLARGVW